MLQPTHAPAYVGRSLSLLRTSTSRVTLERAVTSSQQPVPCLLQVPPPQPIPNSRNNSQNNHAIWATLSPATWPQTTTEFQLYTANASLSNVQDTKDVPQEIQEPKYEEDESSNQFQAPFGLPVQAGEVATANSHSAHSTEPQPLKCSSSPLLSSSGSLPPPPSSPALSYVSLPPDIHKSTAVQMASERPPSSPVLPYASPSPENNNLAVQTPPVTAQSFPALSYVSLPVLHHSAAVQTLPIKPSSSPVVSYASLPIVHGHAAVQTLPATPPLPDRGFEAELRTLRAAQTHFLASTELAAAVTARADADLTRIDTLEAAVRDVRVALRMLDERVGALEPQFVHLRAAAASERLERLRCVEGVARAGHVLGKSVARIEGMVAAAQGTREMEGGGV